METTATTTRFKRKGFGGRTGKGSGSGDEIDKAKEKDKEEEREKSEGIELSEKKEIQSLEDTEKPQLEAQLQSQSQQRLARDGKKNNKIITDDDEKENDEKENNNEGSGAGAGAGTGRGRRKRQTNNEEKDNLILTTQSSSSSKIKIPTKLLLKPKQPYETYREDLDEQKLSYDEIFEFVNVNFGDSTDGFLERGKISWEYSVDRRGSHLLFIEDPKTGLLIAAPLEGLSNVPNNGPPIENREEEDEETHLLASLSSPIPSGEKEDLPGSEMDHSISNILTQILYLFFQGVLAGFSLALPFFIYQSTSDEDLLDSYSESANEIRRFFYILTSVALVGSLDTFISAYYAAFNPTLQINSQPTSLSSPGDSFLSPSRQSKTVDSWRKYLLPAAFFVFLIFFLCFIVSFLMSPMDVLMTHHSEYIVDDVPSTSPSNWAYNALDDPSFRTKFQQWKSLSAVRVVFSVIGWMGNCVIVYIHRMIALETKDDTVKLWDHITGLKTRINSLQGDVFPSDITVSELKQLIRMQKLGVERAEATLKSIEQSSS